MGIRANKKCIQVDSFNTAKNGHLHVYIKVKFEYFLEFGV